MPDSSSKVSWREWASESLEPAHWPTDVGSRAKALASHADSQVLRALRIGKKPVPALQRARIYICGVTPYDTTHLGHAATFVWGDLAARVFRLTGVEVEVCRNITDVDDHLLSQARERHQSWRALATEQVYRFERDMRELSIVEPTYEPRSFDHVDDVVSLAAALVDSGAAYVREGSVYFRGVGVAMAAGLDREEAVAIARERGGHPDDPKKEDPLDSVIWQLSEDDEPAWSSPWGQGRPGWHSECAAMAIATFGSSLDLHVGGADLAFPHHAYESAEAEAFTGVAPFARSWLHVGTVMVGGEKMAKSAGNLVFARDLLERVGPAPLRMMILNRRWDEPWEFEESALDTEAEKLEELSRASAAREGSGSAGNEVVRALLEDLDVPRALAIAAESGGALLRDLMRFLDLV